MSVMVGATPGIFSARSHLNKYGKGDRNDCRRYAKRLGCPLFALVGEAESPVFHEYAREIVAAAGAHAEYHCVEGANHFYNRHTRAIIDRLHNWLRRFDD